MTQVSKNFPNYLSQQHTLMNRLIIAGSRTFSDYEKLKAAIIERYDVKDLHIISGGARGADILGERFAREYNLPLTRYPAEWDLYGKSAGYRRNEDMARNADVCIAFWDGVSKGTKHMIDLCVKHNLVFHIIRF
jgi:hypothetical protein